MTRLLSAFGGMGSLNDVMIHSANNHPVPQDEVDLGNRSLGTLRSAMYTDASARLRDLAQSS